MTVNQIDISVAITELNVTAPISTNELPVIAPVSITEVSVSAPLAYQNVLVEAPLTVEIQEVSAPVILTSQSVIAPIYVGQRGPAGPAGGTTVSYVAATALGGHRIVKLNTDMQAEYASNLDLTIAHRVLGLTTGAVEAESSATIQTVGEITEPSWSWSLDSPIFLGENGLLTQVLPTVGFLLPVAFPISATRIFIKLREPLALN